MAGAVGLLVGRGPQAISLLAHLEELRKRIIYSILGSLPDFLPAGDMQIESLGMCSNRLSKRCAITA